MQRVDDRQKALLRHLRPETTYRTNSPGTKSPDDVVIVSALRTPICKAKRGGFKDTRVEDLLGTVFKASLDRTGVDASDLGDVVVGTVLAPGSQRAAECRIAQFFAGMPQEVSLQTVNRQCSSGLQAIATVASSIRAGEYDIGLAAGVESMTTNTLGWDGDVHPKIGDCQQAQDCLLPMGITSENVAERFHVGREVQDAFAVDSHRKAAKAAASGRFKDEIVPVKTRIIDPRTEVEKEVVISADDGIRATISPEKLGKLPSVFKQGGSTTAGNASQVSDGAGAVLLMKRSEAEARKLGILGVFRSFAAVGVDPSVMGIGPAYAIPKACAQAGISVDQVDLFELNEAFASQATYCMKYLNLDSSKVNVNGGAIALGHPLGATGARCTATLLHEMAKRGPSCRYGVVSMCIGTGMGAAGVFEQEF